MNVQCVGGIPFAPASRRFVTIWRELKFSNNISTNKKYYFDFLNNTKITISIVCNLNLTLLSFCSNIYKK